MTEQLAFSLFDYFTFDEGNAVPATQIAVTAADTRGTTGSLRKQYAYDCGEELLGARKHLASSHAMFSAEWQEAIEEDPTQAYQMVCKDELVGSLRAERFQEEGYTSEAAFVIKQIWDRVSQRPADDPLQRRYFIQAVIELKALFSDAKSVDAVQAAVLTLRECARKAYYTRYEQKVQREPELMTFAHWLSLGDRFQSLFIAKNRSGPGYRKIFDRAFESEEGRDWNWAVRREHSVNRKSNKTVWERMVPDEVIRLSKEPSGVNKPEDIIEQYGFRGVQFGNYVEDAAGRYHVLCSGNAWADLATILKLPRKAISFYGALGIAYGARGSGAAAAHFEPMTNVMNLTKYRGGGAQCHEWAHALDQNLYSYSYRFVNGKRAFISGSEAGPYLPNEVKTAFTSLMKAIKEGTGRRLVKVPDPLPQPKNRYYESVKAKLAKNGYDVSAALRSLVGQYRVKKNMWTDIGFMYCNLLKDAGRAVPTEFYIPSDESLFYADAKARGQYWRRNHELFARAFEAWIEDELAEARLTDSYLVYGTQFGGPYPTGEERLLINAAFRKWWEVLMQAGIFSDDRFWRNAQ